jgi:hypothetical protein
MDEELARPPSTEKSPRQEHSSNDGSKEPSEDAIILESPDELGAFRKLTRKLLTWGVETHGYVYQHDAVLAWSSHVLIKSC